MPTPQDILGATGGGGDSTPIKDVVGQVFTVNDFVWARGTNGAFIVMDVVNDDGREFKVRTGAAAVCDKLDQLKETGALPIEVKVTSFATKYNSTGYDITNPDA